MLLTGVLGLLRTSAWERAILCDPMDCSLSGFNVRGISQAGILEWVAISYSRGSSPPRDEAASLVSCSGRRFLTTGASYAIEMDQRPDKKIQERRYWVSCWRGGGRGCSRTKHRFPCSLPKCAPPRPPPPTHTHQAGSLYGMK